jgi:hypothetical protein
MAAPTECCGAPAVVWSKTASRAIDRTCRGLSARTPRSRFVRSVARRHRFFGPQSHHLEHVLVAMDERVLVVILGSQESQSTFISYTL